MVEYLLFGVLIVLFIAGGLALWSAFDPSFRDVPSSISEGFARDRINILLIGVGGDAHPQGYDALADAIILASLRPSTGEVALISIPRDLYVPVGRYGRHRINRAHAIGAESGFPGKGPGLLIQTVEAVVGQPIDGYVRLDFAAFVAVIDALGGVEVEIETAFHDFLFDDGFDAGTQVLDGDRALRYARYRYVQQGGEGDNFGRERRQQQILSALQARAREIGPTDAMRLMAAAPTVGRYTSTNLSSTEMLRLYRAVRATPAASVRRVSLQPWVEDVFIQRVFDGGEAVAPRGGSFEPIQKAVRDVFNSQSKAAGSVRTADRGLSGSPGRDAPGLVTTMR